MRTDPKKKAQELRKSHESKVEVAKTQKKIAQAQIKKGTGDRTSLIKDGPFGKFVSTPTAKERLEKSKKIMADAKKDSVAATRLDPKVYNRKKK